MLCSYTCLSVILFTGVSASKRGRVRIRGRGLADPPSHTDYGILSTSGWCACYWNAFLFINVKMCEMAAWGTAW